MPLFLLFHSLKIQQAEHLGCLAGTRVMYNKVTVHPDYPPQCMMITVNWCLGQLKYHKQDIFRRFVS